MENRHISFDRVAAIYDDTRGHPAAVSGQITDSLLALLPAQATILEVGVGTGRISRPLLSQGMHVFGIDISSRMMARFQELTPIRTARLHLFQADACSLPFRNQAFQAVLSIHVLHLVKNWQEVLAEMKRVLLPEGLLCTGYDWRDRESPHSQINDQWRKIISKYIENPGHPGPRDFSQVIQFLTDSGGQKDEIEAAAWTYTFSPGRYIQQIEDGTYSYSWRLDPRHLPSCIHELRSWAIKRFGSLEGEYTLPQKFIWQIFRWPKATNSTGRSI